MSRIVQKQFDRNSWQVTVDGYYGDMNGTYHDVIKLTSEKDVLEYADIMFSLKGDSYYIQAIHCDENGKLLMYDVLE